MKCRYCGTELAQWSRFCPKCGGKLSEVMQEEASVDRDAPGETADLDETQDMPLEYEEAPAADKRGLSFVKGLAIGGATLLTAAGIVGGVLFYQNSMEVKAQQEHLVSLMDGNGDLDVWMKNAERGFGSYVLTQEEESRLKELKEKGGALEEKDYENQIRLVEAVKELETAVRTRSGAEASALLEELKSQDPGYASDTQKEQLAEYAEEMQALIEEGSYTELEPLAEEWKSFAAEAAVKKSGYDVSVMQYDFTEYPTVRLYLDVRDTLTGGIVKELSPNMFYVSERDAGNGDFLNRAIQKAVLLDQNECLNINLLADTSGSMEGGNMTAAKNVMKNFLGTVQFSAGDRVKLTQFNSDIDKSGFFTGDSAVLNNIISGYSAQGQTKLYDTIIYGVQDVSGQDGARCVLAFTDGMDVGSYNSAENVVDVVSRYHIPVFIVRIGDDSTAAEDDALRRIAEASGGSFRNLTQFSSDMNEFYNQIYRQMKEYYVVEYQTDSIQNMTQEKEISIYVQNQDKGGEGSAAANPGDELFDSLLGSYLRSYIIDMNNHSYQQLAQYVDSTVDADDKWSIQWQMRKQVSGGFSNVTEESLMDYSVSDIRVVDENTVHIKAVENYDVIYDEIYGELKSSSRTVAEDALSYLRTRLNYSELEDDAQIRIWARVNQIPEYILKKGEDGKWRFSKYAGDLALGERRAVYDVEVTY